MKKESEFNVRSVVEQPGKIELVDALELTETEKLDVVRPCLFDVYADLASRSDAPEKGVSRTVFLEVILLLIL